MGLDQWLNKNGDVVITWRKCNQIHKYFDTVCSGVDNLEECPVTLNDLKHLRETCKKVLDAKSEKVSRQLLPHTMGCFFGSYDYDKWYYEELEWTMDRLDDIISKHTDGDYYTYCAWW